MLLAILAAASAPAWTALPDAELAELRGGFRLPSGIDVALTVRTDTSVNGALLLRSVFTAIGGAPTLQVLAPAKDQTPPAAPASETAESSATAGGVTAAGSAGSSALSVQFDRQNGVVFVPAAAAPKVSVTTGAAAAAAAVADDAAAAGLTVIPVVAGGEAIETAGGQVSIVALRDGARIRLEGAGIDVSHLVGAAFGSAIANTGSDRIIDTTTTIALDLADAGPDVIGSAMLRVDNIAVEAARIGVR